MTPSIEIVTYRESWPGVFRRLGEEIRLAIGRSAARVDHIGSTAVPNLPAKDIIDIQLTADGLTEPLLQALVGIGYRHIAHITHDHVPAGADAAPVQWKKWLFKRVDAGNAVNLHVRLPDASNQRYALLFRDYLRTHATAAAAYGQVKCALARLHTDDADAYYDIKDPVCDIIMAAALEWASAISWQPGPSDC
jgi:GrpB-like predicted nucleotidyltransferase (UPF0157 family)